MINPKNQPTSLGVGLSDNPFQCDSVLCWLKEAEESRKVYITPPGVKCMNLGGASFQTRQLDCDSGKLFQRSRLTI